MLDTLIVDAFISYDSINIFISNNGSATSRSTETRSALRLRGALRGREHAKSEISAGDSPVWAGVGTTPAGAADRPGARVT
jgi:hypothetical protein